MLQLSDIKSKYRMAAFNDDIAKLFFNSGNECAFSCWPSSKCSRLFKSWMRSDFSTENSVFLRVVTITLFRSSNLAIRSNSPSRDGNSASFGPSNTIVASNSEKKSLSSNSITENVCSFCSTHAIPMVWMVKKRDFQGNRWKNYQLKKIE